MKKLIILAFVILNCQAFAIEKKVETKIESVTVFFSGAQVTRTFKAQIGVGESELVLSQLENTINANSIQVRGEGDFVIKSFFTRTNYLEPKDYSAEIKGFAAQLNILNSKLEELNVDLTVLKDEENLILSNRQLAGQQSGLKTEELKNAAEFYRTRLKEIRLEKLNITRSVNKSNKEKQKIQNQMYQIRSVRQESVEEMVVKIEAIESGEANFVISYFVPSASWTPFYEVNVESVNKPIDLVYKASVTQNTGVNWDNVDLTLSTTQPNLSGQVPVLSPWYLNFVQPRSQRTPVRVDHQGKRSSNYLGSGVLGFVRGSVVDADTRESLPAATVIALDANGNTISGASADIDGNFKIELKQKAFTLKVNYIGYESQLLPLNGNQIQVQMFSSEMILEEIVVSDDMEMSEDIAYSQMQSGSIQRIPASGGRANGSNSRPATKTKTYQASQVAQKATFFDYKIKGKNTIPSSKLAEVVHIQNIEVPAKYEYQTVPKLDKDVFLVARIYGWEDFNLLNGSARLYFEKTFVGESYLDVQFTQDTLGLSLGRDKNIVVSRDKVAEQSGVTSMGGNKKEVREFKIQVRNNKSQPVLLRVIDQVPVSTNKKITVKLEEVSEAQETETTGMLKWMLTLEPSMTKECVIKYSVTYPNDKIVNLTE